MGITVASIRPSSPLIPQELNIGFHTSPKFLSKRQIEEQIPPRRVMAGPILKLSGKDEGIAVTVESILSGADSPEKVADCITNIFPSFNNSSQLNHPELGNAHQQIIRDENLSINEFLMLLHKQQILDTALDYMSRELSSNQTKFEILRQAAMTGKISFNIPGEKPLGGLITIRLEGKNLKDWIEAATWHKGRDSIPRSINDELAMHDSGEASTWI